MVHEDWTPIRARPWQAVRRLLKKRANLSHGKPGWRVIVFPYASKTQISDEVHACGGPVEQIRLEHWRAAYKECIQSPPTAKSILVPVGEAGWNGQGSAVNRQVSLGICWGGWLEWTRSACPTWFRS